MATQGTPTGNSAGIRHLKTEPLFVDFTDEDLDLVGSAVAAREFAPGETIIKEGEEGHSLFILESGTVDVAKRTSTGETPRLSSIGAGSIFGELTLLGEKMRSADVVARDQVKVYELDYDKVNQLVISHPALGVKIYRIITKGIIEKIRKTTEDLLSIVVSSRMAALGEMASGIAHEITSPLTIIQMHAESVDEQVKLETINKSVVQKNASKILFMVDRIGKLIKSVRALSRNASNDAMIAAPVQEILDQTLELCQARFKDQSVGLKQEVPATEIKLVCRPVQVSQVLLNLMNNAYDAVKGLDERWVRVSVEDKGDTVEFAVTDSGKGIPLEIREKIFQSFFTTKRAGEGTGLGLNIALKIIQEHKGSISVDATSPNTRFVVTLPKK